jgi:hypothetical protein
LTPVVAIARRSWQRSKKRKQQRDGRKRFVAEKRFLTIELELISQQRKYESRLSV